MRSWYCVFLPEGKEPLLASEAHYWLHRLPLRGQQVVAPQAGALHVGEGSARHAGPLPQLWPRQGYAWHHFQCLPCVGDAVLSLVVWPSLSKAFAGVRPFQVVVRRWDMVYIMSVRFLLSLACSCQLAVRALRGDVLAMWDSLFARPTQ